MVAAQVAPGPWAEQCWLWRREAGSGGRMEDIHHPGLLQACGQQRPGCQPHGDKRAAAVAWPVPQGSPGCSFPCSPSTERVRSQPCVCISTDRILLLSLSCETTSCCHFSPAAEEKPSSASLCGEPQPPLIPALALLKLNLRLFWWSTGRDLHRGSSAPWEWHRCSSGTAGVVPGRSHQEPSCHISREATICHLYSPSWIFTCPEGSLPAPSCICAAPEGNVCLRWGLTSPFVEIPFYCSQVWSCLSEVVCWKGGCPLPSTALPSKLLHTLCNASERALRVLLSGNGGGCELECGRLLLRVWRGVRLCLCVGGGKGSLGRAAAPTENL